MLKHASLFTYEVLYSLELLSFLKKKHYLGDDFIHSGIMIKIHIILLNVKIIVIFPHYSLLFAELEESSIKQDQYHLGDFYIHLSVQDLRLNTKRT